MPQPLKGMTFFDKHYHLNIYLVKNDTSQLSIKSESIDYLLHKVKLSLPNENNSDAKITDPVLYRLYAKLVNSVDEKEKK